MILYKYTEIAGKDILFNSRIKVSDPRLYNDPFELALHVKSLNPSDIKKHTLKKKHVLREYYDRLTKKGQMNISWKVFWKEISDPNNREKKAQGLAETLSKDFENILNQQDGSVTKYFYLCCFSGETLKEMDEVLMWSHYSKGHTGLRFSMESDSFIKQKREIEKVKYSEHIVKLDPVGFLTKDEKLIRETMEESLSTKSKSWEYEQEYRWFVDSQNCRKDAISGEFFTNFNPNAIKRIDFGERCPKETIEEIKQKVSELGLRVEFKKVILHKVDYKLNYIDL